MSQWRDQIGYRWCDPVTWTVQVTDRPGPPLPPEGVDVDLSDLAPPLPRTTTNPIDEALLRELCEETRTVQ